MYIKNYSDYDNYRWINCNRWSTAKEVDALVENLVQGISSRKVGGYRINMKALVLDLYQSFLCDPEQYLAYSRREVSYLGAGNDHPYIKNHNVTYQYLLKCIDYLLLEGMIENQEGGYFRDDKANRTHSFASRMRPLNSLLAVMEEYGVTPEMICDFVPVDVIILRGKEDEKTGVKPDLRYPKNKVTTRMATLIRQYNALLERTHIDVDIECLTNADRNKLVCALADMNVAGTKRIVLRLSSKSVYRVFNNGSMEQGGRYYKAWWISAPSIVRKYITIQGEPTIELDFSAMHIHLLYAKVGINYSDKKEDAYTLEHGLHSLQDKDDDRDLNKLILLTAFNATTPEKAVSAVFDDLRKEHKLYKYSIHNHDRIKAKLDLLKIKHPLISDMVANDYGRELQYYDSCVIERVIKHFTSKSVPVLTVHDSVICQAHHEEHVRNMMVRYFYQVVAELLTLSVKPTPLYSRASFILSYLNSIMTYRTGSIKLPIVSRLNAVRYPNYKGSITDTIASTLAVKKTSRSNTCYKKCSHNIRAKHMLKFMPNIKLEIQELIETGISILSIR